MSDDGVLQVVTMVLGGLGALLIFLFGLWWKIESRQDRKIDELHVSNGKEHRDLHDKIDENHHALRDRLDAIWKHMRPKD